MEGYVFCCKIDRNECKIVFSKRKISKISRLRRAALLQSPRNVQFITLFSLLKSFSNLQWAIALSTHAQNAFSTDRRAETWLYHIYGRHRALHIRTKRVLQTVIGTRQKLYHI